MIGKTLKFILFLTCTLVLMGGFMYRFFSCCTKNRFNNGGSLSPYEKTPRQIFSNESAMNITVSLAPLTICEALRQGSIALKAHYTAYTPVTQMQKEFIQTQYFPYVQNNVFEQFSADELKAYASCDYKYLNDMLKKNGFAIKLQPFSPDESMGVVAIQDIIVTWPNEGQKTTLSSNNQNYDAVHLKKNIHFYTKPNDNSHVIIKLTTKTDDIVCFVVQLTSPFFDSNVDEKKIAQSLMRYHRALHDGTYTQSSVYDDVIFPMITYDKQPHIEWLLGLLLHVKNQEYAIAQALQQIIFKMNEKGAVAKAATAMEMRLTSIGPGEPKKTLIVDKPFLLFVERPGVPMPLFADYMQEKYWKNPGDLSL